MKKLLLGTTALVAAGAFAVAAQADEMMEEPVSVGLAGYTMGAAFIASDGDDDKRSHAIDYVYEIAVSGSSTLDNGITVGVSGQIGRSGKGTIDGFDEIHTTFSGSFGTLRLGRTESAAYNATVAAPGNGISFGLGVNYTWFNGAADGVNTFSGIGEEDAMKVVYTSPNFNGLTIGLSYAPNDEDTNVAVWDGEDRSTQGLGEHTAVAATYSTDFMDGGSVTLGAGYEMASGTDGDGNEDPTATRAGINVSIDEVSFGGGMYDHEMNGMQFDVGASYSMGEIDLGLQFANNDSGDATKTALNLTYNLGPGVLIGGQVASASADGMEDVTQFMLGTAVFF